ncbi:hypothetical protein LTR66_003394 [Elasticomyces elasticus]|nr:hypothetical protein LTR50_004100 [Elasticomyces elasticus]KAK4997138.1 hypothetical protein LTR66_003394 [Elasticomyces elasticus]
MLAGDAYCVALSSAASSAFSATRFGTSTTTAVAATATAQGKDVYKTYTGDGTVAAGWPAIEDWVSFDYMFNANLAQMTASCAQWSVPNDSTQETQDIYNSIVDIANTTQVDERFILATIMQESTGCVRVITTSYSVANPGLMQSHDGAGSCNRNGVVQTPCPQSEIHQMIEDGTAGTRSGDGLQQLLIQAQRLDVSRFYRAARMYNGGAGSIGPNGDLQGTCCTKCYASDVANRLTGWVAAPHTCTL